MTSVAWILFGAIAGLLIGLLICGFGPLAAGLTIAAGGTGMTIVGAIEYRETRP